MQVIFPFALKLIKIESMFGVHLKQFKRELADGMHGGELVFINFDILLFFRIRHQNQNRVIQNMRVRMMILRL